MPSLPSNRFRRLVSLVGLFVLFFSMLPSCGRSGEDATLKHQFARTSVARTRSPQSCRDGNTHKNIITYVKNLIRYLSKANPKAFNGDLDGSKVCVVVEDAKELSASMDPNSGTMSINTGIFQKKYGLDSDAAIATILAHELAHFTMDHANVRPTALDLPPDYDVTAYEAKLAEYKAFETKSSAMIAAAFERVTRQHGANLVDAMAPIFADIATLQGDARQLRDNEWTTTRFANFKADLEAYQNSGETKKYQNLMSGYLFSHMESAQAYRTKLRPEIRDASEPWGTMSSAEKLKNQLVSDAKEYDSGKLELVPELKRLRAPHFQWDEEQADEVGFEFFIRAGFEPAVFPELLNKLAHHVEGAGDCAKEVNQNSMPPRIHPDREPRGNHPDACWRYWNLRFQEPKIHDVEYTRLMPRVPLMDLPQLAGQREAIELEISR